MPISSWIQRLIPAAPLCERLIPPRRLRCSTVAPLVELLEERRVLSATTGSLLHDHGGDGDDNHSHAALYAIVGGDNGGEAPSGAALDIRKWSQPDGLGTPVTITYSYSNLLDGSFAPHLSARQIRTAIEEAFAAWAQVAPLHFVEVPDAGPDVADINYAAAGLPMIRLGHLSIDGGTGTNALAQSWLPFEDGLGGDIHFDNTNSWSVNGGSSGYSLREVALHEIGHALGLTHELIVGGGESSGVMNPRHRRLFPGGEALQLLADDIADIQTLYGAGSGSVTPLASWSPPPTGAAGNPVSSPGGPTQISLSLSGAPPFLNDAASNPGGELVGQPSQPPAAITLFDFTEHQSPSAEEQESSPSGLTGQTNSGSAARVIGGTSQLVDHLLAGEQFDGPAEAPPGTVRLTSHHDEAAESDRGGAAGQPANNSESRRAEPSQEQGSADRTERPEAAASTPPEDASTDAPASPQAARDHAAPCERLQVVWKDGVPRIEREPITSDPSASHPAAALLLELARPTSLRT